ncbi:hypothetical protein BCR39DRAFT_578826 [Naematelia encephala]|uniref:Uncharacterized protein n=1 Tax=Naematelia encephala TaxID=71784 RepID=A0A1Y2AVJ3_9TREE|nr:hypothetical protein BCR39DRAFT_578826 [Naematelia encephala]
MSEGSALCLLETDHDYGKNEDGNDEVCYDDEDQEEETEQRDHDENDEVDENDENDEKDDGDLHGEGNLDDSGEGNSEEETGSGEDNDWTIEAPRSSSPPCLTTEDTQGLWLGSLVYRLLPRTGLLEGETDTYYRCDSSARTSRWDEEKMICSAKCSQLPALKCRWSEGRIDGTVLNRQAVLCRTHLDELLERPVPFSTYRGPDYIQSYRQVGELCSMYDCQEAGHSWTRKTASGKSTTQMCDKHVSEIAASNSTGPVLKPRLRDLYSKAMAARKDSSIDEMPSEYQTFLDHLCLGVGPEIETEGYQPVPTCFRAKHPNSLYCPRDQRYLNECWLSGVTPQCRLQVKSHCSNPMSDPTSGLCSEHRKAFQISNCCITCNAETSSVSSPSNTAPSLSIIAGMCSNCLRTSGVETILPGLADSLEFQRTPQGMPLEDDGGYTSRLKSTMSELTYWTPPYVQRERERRREALKASQEI